MAVVVAAGTILLAKLIDLRVGRAQLDPAAATRYRVLRRSAISAVVFVGVLSAALVIPQVRAVAGGILASGAVVGLVVGVAAQRTIGNFIAGIMIALSQPLRLGDEVEVAGGRGVVEEIGLTYTWLRLDDGDRLVIPNQNLVSDALRNSTIRSERRLAQVDARVSLPVEVDALLAQLRDDGIEAYLADLGSSEATVVARRWIGREARLEAAESELRIAIHDRLRLMGAGGK